MSVVSRFRPRRGRNVELALIILATAIVLLAYVNVGLATSGEIPSSLLVLGGGFFAVALAFHLVLRWKASYADPLLLPIATLLNGLGLVMIHRLDLAHGRSIGDGMALRQLMWSALSVGLAMAAIVIMRDHRVLRRYTFTAGLLGFVLLLLPMLPVIGDDKNGSKIWISAGAHEFSARRGRQDHPRDLLRRLLRADT
jgi:hypothetical protein